MEPEILRASKGAVHYAANKFQWNFIDGFISQPDVALEVLSAAFVGTFPKEYRRLFVRGTAISYKGSVPCEYVPFNNLWGYRNLSRKRALIKAIRPFANRKSPDKVIIEVLNMKDTDWRAFGQAAREFVIRSKTGEVACERIIRMIRENRK